MSFWKDFQAVGTTANAVNAVLDQLAEDEGTKPRPAAPFAGTVFSTPFEFTGMLVNSPTHSGVSTPSQSRSHLSAEELSAQTLDTLMRTDNFLEEVRSGTNAKLNAFLVRKTVLLRLLGWLTWGLGRGHPNLDDSSGESSDESTESDAQQVAPDAVQNGVVSDHIRDGKIPVHALIEEEHTLGSVPVRHVDGPQTRTCEGYPQIAHEVLVSDIPGLSNMLYSPSEVAETDAEKDAVDPGEFVMELWNAVLSATESQIEEYSVQVGYWSRVLLALLGGSHSAEVFQSSLAVPHLLPRLVYLLPMCSPVSDVILELVKHASTPAPSAPDEDRQEPSPLVPGVVTQVVRLLDPSSAQGPAGHAAADELLRGIIELFNLAANVMHTQQTQAIMYSQQMQLQGAPLHQAPEVVWRDQTLVQTLARKPVVSQLADWALAPGGAAEVSALIAIFSVLNDLIRKNNSNLVEQQMLMWAKQRETATAHAEMTGSAGPSEDRGPSIVDFSELLTVFSARVGALQELLRSPRTSLQPVATTAGVMQPLTVERFKICELYAELLHCSNMSAVNRPREVMESLFTESGHLRNGHYDLERLAQLTSLTYETLAEGGIEQGAQQSGEQSGDQGVETMQTHAGARTADSEAGSHNDESVASDESNEYGASQSGNETRANPSSEGTQSAATSPAAVDVDEDPFADPFADPVEGASVFVDSDDAETETNEDDSPKKPSVPNGLVHEEEQGGDNSDDSGVSESIGNKNSAEQVKSDDTEAQINDRPSTQTDSESSALSSLDTGVARLSVDGGVEKGGATSEASLQGRAEKEDDVKIAVTGVETAVEKSNETVDVVGEKDRDVVATEATAESTANGADNADNAEDQNSGSESHTTSDGSNPDGSAPTLVGELFKYQLLQNNVLETLVELFFSFPLNNFLQNVIFDIIQQIFGAQMDKRYNAQLVLRLFREGALVRRVLSEYKASAHETVQDRAYHGIMGHMLLIVDEILNLLARCPDSLRAEIRATFPPEWEPFVTETFPAIQARVTAPLAGGIPAHGLPSAPGQLPEGADLGPDDDVGLSSEMVEVVIAADTSDDEDAAPAFFGGENELVLGEQQFGDLAFEDEAPARDKFSHYLASSLTTEGDSSDESDDDVAWVSAGTERNVPRAAGRGDEKGAQEFEDEFRPTVQRRRRSNSIILSAADASGVYERHAAGGEMSGVSGDASGETSHDTHTVTAPHEPSSDSSSGDEFGEFEMAEIPDGDGDGDGDNDGFGDAFVADDMAQGSSFDSFDEDTFSDFDFKEGERRIDDEFTLSASPPPQHNNMASLFSSRPNIFASFKTKKGGEVGEGGGASPVAAAPAAAAATPGAIGIPGSVPASGATPMAASGSPGAVSQSPNGRIIVGSSSLEEHDTLRRRSSNSSVGALRHRRSSSSAGSADSASAVPMSPNLKAAALATSEESPLGPSVHTGARLTDDGMVEADVEGVTIQVPADEIALGRRASLDGEREEHDMFKLDLE